jgi:hypothetical protein
MAAKQEPSVLLCMPNTRDVSYYGCQAGTKRPALRARQAQVCPIGFSNERSLPRLIHQCRRDWAARHSAP